MPLGTPTAWEVRCLGKILDKVEEWASSVLLMVMVSVAFVNVVTRYFVKFPLAFTEELEVNLFVWLVLLGTSIAFRRGSHLNMSFLVDLMPDPLKRLCHAAGFGLTVLFFVVLGYLGYLEVMDEIALGVTTESLDIPVWYYTISMPMLSVLILVRVLGRFLAKGKL